MNILKLLLNKIAKGKKTIHKSNRIPSQLHDIVAIGEYIRKNPYPLDKIAKDFKSKPFVTKQTKIVTMGSCFAQELQAWLRENEYTCLPHEWGVVYSPQSIAQIVQYSLDRKSWQPKESFWVISGKYYYPYLKSNDHKGARYLGENEISARKALEVHYKKSAQLLKETELVLWNLGLTELWRNKNDRLAFYAVPFPEVYDKDSHEFYSLTYQDIIDKLEYAIVTLKRFNPNVKILLAVDPVPLSISFRPHLGPYVATQYSKSILVVAAMTLVEKHDDVFYMPTYEIIRNNPSIYYKSDGRHINKKGIKTIMEAFNMLYVIKQTKH